jgi:oxygen-independent coproporphyrinogen-3 oxidase
LRPEIPDQAGFGVYLHWPFCASKCPYCDFNSHVRQRIDEERFLAAMRRELAHWSERIGVRAIDSVFFGGGTPSLMSASTVASLIDEIARLWSLPNDAEITLEANPGSVEAQRFAGYRAAGVNRVSLGVQSLRDGPLAKLGRMHTVEEAKAAIDVARRTFERFSFDLIYARSGQTVAEWRDELADALALAGGHLSLYQLTIEDGTSFARLHEAGKLVVPEAELAVDLYALTGDMTAASGLCCYEISNYAVPGEECRHNMLYWRYGEYVGVGPGAHGRPIAQGQRLQTSTERNPERWMTLVEAKGHGLAECEGLSQAQQADEALLMGLRLSEGLPLERLRGLGAAARETGTIEGLEKLGLLERPETGWIRATPAGRLVLNSVVAELSRALV